MGNELVMNLAETKVKKTILGCLSFKQLTTAKRMMDNYEKQFGYSVELYEILDMKIDELSETVIHV
jgi:hypothetical protein